MRLIINKSTARIVLAAALAANPAAAAQRARYIMGTVCAITVHGSGADEAATAAFEEIGRLERMLSTFIPASELSALNRAAGAGPVPVSPELWELLELSAEVHRLSGGAFDPTYASPAAARGMDRVRLDPARRTVRLLPGARLDLGGVAKGYALDRAAAVLRSRGAQSALLDFGGQLLALGAPPGEPGWRARVGGTERVALLADASLSTSGQEERPGHIVDPSTGRPAPARPAASVILPRAAEADAWSTALFILGPDRPPSAFPGCAVYSNPVRAAQPGPFLFGDCAPHLGPKNAPAASLQRRRRLDNREEPRNDNGIPHPRGPGRDPGPGPRPSRLDPRPSLGP